MRGSCCGCQASDDVYGKQIEHERKETGEFLRLSISPLPLAGKIPFGHDAVACESAAACRNSLPQGESGLCSAASEITVTVNGKSAPHTYSKLKVTDEPKATVRVRDFIRLRAKPRCAA